MQEDLNLSSNNTNIKIIPYVTQVCANRVCYKELSFKAQAALDARKIADLNTQLEGFEIYNNVTQKQY